MLTSLVASPLLPRAFTADGNHSRRAFSYIVDKPVVTNPLAIRLLFAGQADTAGYARIGQRSPYEVTVAG